METKKKGNGLAIFSLICGISCLVLGFIVVGIIPAIAGI